MKTGINIVQQDVEETVEKECALSPLAYTFRQPLYLHKRQRPPLSANPSSQNEAEVMFNLSLQHLLPNSGRRRNSRIMQQAHTPQARHRHI